MLALREAHVRGATRVSIAGHHLLTGGADGVVSLFPIKQWPASPALWSFKCHEGAVTDVVLADALELALSCGRDGRILLHEHIFDTTRLISRVICQVTGEVRCLQLDAERRRAFIAGDSLRCLDMSQGHFQLRTIPLVVAFPIVALAVSPCGRYIAMASASGDVGVVSAATPPSTTTTTAAEKVQFVLRAVLSPTAKRDDASRYRMAWCALASPGSLLLMVPTTTEIQVFQLEDGGAATGTGGTPRIRAVGGLHDAHLNDLHGAHVYHVSKNRLAVVMASRDGIFVGKVESKSLSMTRHTSEVFSTVTPLAESHDAVAVTDVVVNPSSCDVAVGLADGRVSLLGKAALREWRPTGPPSASDTKRDAAAVGEGEDEEVESDGDEEDVKHLAEKNSTLPAPPAAAAAVVQKRKHQTSRSVKRQGESEEDDFINDSDGDTASESSFSSSGSSASSSDSCAAPENMRKVFLDLQRSGASVRANDEDRPSRWRRGDAAAALAYAERDVERTRSRFLDDEAEEGSTESEDEEMDNIASGARGRRGGGVRQTSARRPLRDRDAGDLDEEDEEEGDFRDDNDSIEGQVEVEGNDECGDGQQRGGRRTTAAPTAASRLALSGAGVAGVQDYSFQVGATPAGAEGSCYLAYNSVGYIHCSREATTIHFHDISYPAVRLQLRDTVLMGALSPVGAGFVVVPVELADAQGSVDEAPRLTILYHAFTPLGAQSEWRVPLLLGETVRCMAAGIRYLAVATSHYLRLFSLSGLELAVLSKCQRIVTMVGTSSRALMSSFKADFDPLALVTLSGTGELQMEVIDVGARAAALPARAIPLTELPDGSTHQLQWLGWSEDGLLHTADTAGVVRMFTEDWGGAWVPVYDPRTLTDQSFALWVYGVSTSALLAYRHSRDDASYPAAAASGLSTELVPLSLPLTRTMGEEGRELWDQLLRQQVRTDELKRHSTFYSPAIAKADDLHDRRLLQFFDSALKTQQTTRALELAMLMEIHERVAKCAQMANNRGYDKLVPKLLKLFEMRVANKSRRRCTLPLKEALMSERKKDELLRKLLGQLQQTQDKRATAVEAPSAVRAAEASGTSPNTAVRVEEESAEDIAKSVSGKEREASRLRSPPCATYKTAATSPSAASTATTAGVDVAPPLSASSTARRHISFARESPAPSSVLSPTLTSSATPTSNATAGTSGAPRRVSNPFAKPAAAAAVSKTTPTVTPASVRPTTTTTTTAAPAPPVTQHSRAGGTTAPTAATSAPRQMSLLGATPPRTTMMMKSAAAANTTNASNIHTTAAAVVAAASSSLPSPPPPPPARSAVVGTPQFDGEDAAGGRPSLKMTPEDRRVSAGRTATTSPRVSPDHSTSLYQQQQQQNTSATVKPAATVGFVARELPTHHSQPVDPFLESLAEEGTSYRSTASAAGSAFAKLTSGGSSDDALNAEGAMALSVQSLLDVGHSETAPVVRSDSFGEALRKRYREDDEDEGEDGEGVGAPPVVVPKLTL